MAKATVKYLDEKKRRIILPKEIVEIEDLHVGDFIEIDVKKIGHMTKESKNKEDIEDHEKI